MITKTQYANQIVKEFIDQRNLDIKGITEEDLVYYVYQSTSLGVALETLGVLTKEKYPEEYEYLSNRGGVFKIAGPDTDGNVQILTTREFIDLLPDKL